MNPTAIIGGVIGILDKVIPDPEARAKAITELTKLEQEVSLKQLDVNIAEASTGHWFIGGWRPFIGWVSGFCFLYAVIGRDILMVLGKTLFDIDPNTVPVLDNTLLGTVLLGILGLGAARTFEKVKGAAR